MIRILFVSTVTLASGCAAFEHETPEFVAVSLDRVAVLSSALEDADSDDRAALLVQRGLNRRTVGHFDAAVSDFTEAIELEPQNWKPRFHRWQLYLQMGEFEKAETDRSVGLRLNPSEFGPNYLREHAGVI